MKQGSGKQQNQQRRHRHKNRNQNFTQRALDSHGPDVKVRGTAAHICKKYQSLARDAQLAGNRIKAENYLQHADHYYRIVIAAQNQGQQQQQQQKKQQNQAQAQGVSQTGEAEGISAAGSLVNEATGSAPAVAGDAAPAAAESKAD